MRKPQQEIEFHPAAMQRFERAVDAAIKSGPKHRVAKKNLGKVETKPTKAKKLKQPEPPRVCRRLVGLS